MTIKQLARRLTKNAETFTMEGDLIRAFACLEVAAVIHREGYINMRGSLFPIEEATTEDM